MHYAINDELLQAWLQERKRMGGFHRPVGAVRQVIQGTLPGPPSLHGC
jgi:hypothetical protein